MDHWNYQTQNVSQIELRKDIMHGILCLRLPWVLVGLESWDQSFCLFIGDASSPVIDLLPLGSVPTLHCHAWNGFCNHFFFTSWHHVKFCQWREKREPSRQGLSFLVQMCFSVLVPTVFGHPAAELPVEVLGQQVSMVPTAGSFLESWHLCEVGSIPVGGACGCLWQLPSECHSRLCWRLPWAPSGGSLHPSLGPRTAE